jgi:predicted dehydrogenase
MRRIPRSAREFFNRPARLVDGPRSRNPVRRGSTSDMTASSTAIPTVAASRPDRSVRVLRTAMIGGGKISEQHLEPLAGRRDVQVVSICDLSPSLARFEAERFGVPSWSTDYRAMLAEQRPDVVHVLTPPATHAGIVRDCLASGAHVIVEKPAALSNAAFREMWQDADSRGLRLMENHNYRFNAPIRALEAIVDAEEIGRIEEVEVRMALGIRGGGRYADEHLPHPSHRLPAGVLHEFVSHLGYLLLRFMPEHAVDRFDSVHASWRNIGGGVLFKYDELDARLVCGSVSGRMRFTTRQWPDHFSVFLRGSQGTASAELFQPGVQITRRRTGGQHLSPLVNSVCGAASMVRCGTGSLWGKIRNRTAYEGLHLLLNQTYDALHSGEALPITFPQMDETSRLIDLLLSSEAQS